ncbi:glutathione hydrolase 3-like [Humulus lupulus]|uniref:glutathione hydrolase 3-like n=1 Tax=Humulus lupulus TaxID=3486 RepID=UPI002B40F008|nr:glutathione hydrolase 3-like [Humulus lupulus]
MTDNQSLSSPLLAFQQSKRWSKSLWCLLPITLTIIVVLLLVPGSNLNVWIQKEGNRYNNEDRGNDDFVIESHEGVVAADVGICSEIGASFLRQNGHAVDAAVATALCLGILNPVSTGIGGGGFMIVRSSTTLKSQAFDFRETAPSAASENMYANAPSNKLYGPLSAGVPGEIAGLHKAWLKYGRLEWSTLFQPAIKLAKGGFLVSPFMGQNIRENSHLILSNHGLRQVFAPNGKLLKAGDTCYNVELGRSLEQIAELGPDALYNGPVGEKLVKDVREAGGILTMEDLRNYKVETMDAMVANVMGYTLFGMPPPSSGTLGLSLIANVFDSYGSPDAAKGDLGVHRVIESIKHMFAVRMNLGDPNFVDTSKYEADMRSTDFAKQIRERIFDNTTFPPEYYMYRWSQLKDHGTSHFCIVDKDRNAVSMTTTVNSAFGGGVLSTSTGIVLNNEMGDFSTPTETTPDNLPPAPANFIRPNKRPLSSMTPLIITKDDQLVGLLGGSGGLNIIPAVTQVFLNHFVLGMKPLDAVQRPRVYHLLIPNKVTSENWTVICGNRIEVSERTKLFLEERGHLVEPRPVDAVTQLVVVKKLKNPTYIIGRENGKFPNAQPVHDTLIAVSDPRKDGRPAAC